METELPERFTFPFNYTPHPLCIMAAGELQRYIASREEWRDELERGKMFGVLIVQTAEGTLGYLAAYSGLLAGRNDIPFFVPPVFDSQQPHGYFKTHENGISSLNNEISSIESSPEYIAAKTSFRAMTAAAETDISSFRQKMKASKAQRDSLRASCNDMGTEESDKLIKESQYQKAELRRIKKRWNDRLDESRKCLATFAERIQTLKKRRKEESDKLQHWLFGKYDMLNAKGESRNLLSIFADTPQGVPPAGAGDCCAPKLLQYAYRQGMRPICMAEFWWGQSPKTEIRHHLHYYPACHSKCKPILAHMLQGLNVDSDPHDNAPEGDEELRILYEDESIIVVDKPAGLLSVPGRVARKSVTDILCGNGRHGSFLMPAHRLDMATSGIVVIAKDPESLRRLHGQFAARKVEKRYRAILDGIPDAPRQGTIRLPLAADLSDRPRQIVDHSCGKFAETAYEIIRTTETTTEILLYPHTGRTHQLRVHCAHAEGLAAPILGDPLYGHSAATRMYLHAEYISFTHPATGARLAFESEAHWPAPECG